MYFVGNFIPAYQVIDFFPHARDLAHDVTATAPPTNRYQLSKQPSSSTIYTRAMTHCRIFPGKRVQNMMAHRPMMTDLTSRLNSACLPHFMTSDDGQAAKTAPRC